MSYSNQFNDSETKKLLENEVNFEAEKYISSSTETEQLTHRNKIIECLYEILPLEDSNFNAFDYNLELVDCVDKILDNYKTDGGNFMHYFRKSFKWVKVNAYNKEVKRENKFIRLKDDDENDENGLTAEDKLEYLNHITEKNDYCGYGFVAQKMSDKYRVNSILSSINHAYNSLQNRTKPFFSKFVTNFLFECLDRELIDECEVRKLPYFDSIEFDRLRMGGKVLAQKDYAEIYGMVAPNVSRSINGFRAAMQKSLREDKVA